MYRGLGPSYSARSSEVYSLSFSTDELLTAKGVDSEDCAKIRSETHACREKEWTLDYIPLLSLE